MSHLVTIKHQFLDLDTLATAAKECGLELVRHQRTFKWYGQSVGDYPLPEGFQVEDLGKCEHAIRIPGDSRAYEIGVVRRRDGKPGWTLLFDFWGSCGKALEDKAGHRCSGLIQQYVLAQTKKTLQRQGKRVLGIKMTEDGHMRVQVGR